MNATLEYMLAKYQADPEAKPPTELQENRQGLAQLFRELKFTVGAEIGVEQGYYSEVLCRANPDLHLYCVDPWVTYTRYADHVSQSKLDRYYAEAIERLKPYHCVVLRVYSLQAVREFESDSLDFVYIDGNHEFEFVVNDIIGWHKVVRPGGIISGHDYRRDKADRIPFHVKQAVQAYTDAYRIRPWFVLRGDKDPSWMWVKP